jgi:hypothetical protein
MLVSLQASQYDTFNIPHNEDLEEYNNLVKLYHVMPKDLLKEMICTSRRRSVSVAALDGKPTTPGVI